MKACAIRIIFIVLSIGVLQIGATVPANSSMPDISKLDWIPCGPDGNNAHTSAEIVDRFANLYGSVCEDDPHDWYMMPLPGDVLWGGYLTCLANRPGLRVALYVDTGAGPELLGEESPILDESWGEGAYAAELDVLDLATAAGYAAGPPANYYVRITYYSYHPGNHPYLVWLRINRHDFLPADYPSPAAARPLPPGIFYYGHLDATDISDWFRFDIPPGQTGTGLIFGRNIFNPTDFDIKLYDSAMSLVAAANVNTAGMGCIELTPCTPLSPGTYYIEVIQPDPWPSDTELYYSLFNHALAPNTGGWAADTNIDPASSIPLVEATPVNGTVYWPRDEGDYLSFSSDYYFLGDIYMVPSLNSSVLYSSVEEADGVLHRSMWIPGMGKTNSEYPLPPDDYFIHLRDARTWLYPINYSAVLYRHGPSMTVPAGHDTWATALELPAATGTDPGSYYVPNAGIDLQPGIQEVFFSTLTVPADRYLVGYYEIIGSRPHYRVRLGKIGPGGIPVWSPGINADSQAKVTIDMNYSYLSDAGTYFLKIEMLPSCPGKMRVFIDNNSRIAECASDDNNAYSDALDLGMYHRDYYHWRSGDMCPPDDEVDWYFFNSGFFDPDEGPKKNICLRGGAEGMRIELYNGYMNLQGMAETTSVGGYATIDLDGILIGGLPMAVGQNYYVKVMANSSEDRIQVYDLQLRNDLVILRPIWNFLDLYKVRLPYHLLENLES